MARSSKAEEVAGQILSIARREGLEPGARLVELQLADALGVSRGPVRAGLQALARAGIVTGRRHHGYVLAKSPASKPARSLAGPAEQLYQRIADDRFKGRLPEIVTESELQRRYDAPRALLLRLLDRIAAEGWVTRTPGYGWRFAATLSSQEAYAQSLAFRAVIEPAALSSPGYRLDPAVIARLRTQQRWIMERGLDSLTTAEIFATGCTFHEELVGGAGNSFFREALQRVNSIRRLFAYRTYADRDEMRRHLREHLRLLDLIADQRMKQAATLMKRHLARSPKLMT
jgi:DNA-binding GntR family transcriptional regulator